MKKIMMVAMALIVAMSSVYAADKDEKAAKKEAKNLAKSFIKDGWTIKPGVLSIESQQEEFVLMKKEKDERKQKKYIFGTGNGIGESYTAAQRAASLQAATNLAEQMGMEFTALTEGEVANGQLEEDDAKSITEAVEGSQRLIAQSIGRTISVVEMYRLTKQKTYEVQVTIAYDSKMSMEIVKKAVGEKLGEKSQKLRQKLDKITGI